MPRPNAWGFCLCILAWPGALCPAEAQVRTARFEGRVVDHQTGLPVGGAVIALRGDPVRTVSDDSGRFERGGLAAGLHIVEVRAVGYAAGTWGIEVASAQVLSAVLRLKLLVHQLPEVVVLGEPGGVRRSLAEFHRRRQRGMGLFITEEEIAQRGATTLGELVRTLAGVEVNCGGGTCMVRMVRSPRRCTPEYFLDGFPASFSTGPNYPLTGVVAVEIYRSASETPIEFQRTSLMCGVIAVWSKPPPSRSRPRESSVPS